jgi:hypothetical protein
MEGWYGLVGCLIRVEIGFLQDESIGTPESAHPPDIEMVAPDVAAAQPAQDEVVSDGIDKARVSPERNWGVTADQSRRWKREYRQNRQ